MNAHAGLLGRMLFDFFFRKILRSGTLFSNEMKYSDQYHFFILLNGMYLKLAKNKCYAEKKKVRAIMVKLIRVGIECFFKMKSICSFGPISNDHLIHRKANKKLHSRNKKGKRKMKFVQCSFTHIEALFPLSCSQPVIGICHFLLRI